MHLRHGCHPLHLHPLVYKGTSESVWQSTLFTNVAWAGLLFFLKRENFWRKLKTRMSSSKVAHFQCKWMLSCSPVSYAEVTPLVFGVPLYQVISNDRTLKQRHDPPWEGHSDPTELMLSFLHLTSSFKRTNREFSSSNSSLSSSEAPNESTVISTADAAPRTRRRVGCSDAGFSRNNKSINKWQCTLIPFPAHL